MSTTQAGSEILAIANDNTFAHAYASVADLLQDDDIGAGPGERSGPLEFFDSTGHRLAPVFDTGWRLRDLTPTADRADAPAVQQRLAECVAHLGTFLARHPEEAAAHGLGVDEAIALLPRVDAAPDLAASLAAFSAVRDDGVLPPAVAADSQGWFHNLRHRTGWTHS
jgi:hypothetical protein